MRPVCLPIAASKETALAGKSWRKELAYDAELFLIAPDGQAAKTPISTERLKEWHRSFQRMKELGVTVPVPLGHSTDPKARVGKLNDLQLAMDSKNRQAIFSVIDFDDGLKLEDVEAYSKSDVSVFVEDWLDPHTGRTSEAITHVAVTSRPQIPGLDKFVMALSLDEASLKSLQKDPKGSPVADERKISAQLQRLADKHKVDISGANDDDAAVAILEAKLGPSLAPSAKGEGEAAAEAGTGTGPVKTDPGHSSPQGSVSAAHEAKYNGLIKTTATQICASRKAVLNSLVTGRFSTPAGIKRLVDRYTDVGKVSAALQSDTFDDQDSAFNDAIEAIKEGGERFGHEMSGAQTASGQKQEFGIVADARKRREKLKG